MALNAVIEHDDVGDPLILAIADQDEALIVYRRRLEEMAVQYCDIDEAHARNKKTKSLELLLGDWRGNQSSRLNGLFLLEEEPTADAAGEETWTHVTLDKPLDKAFVTVGPLTVHVSHTDEGVIADVWGHESDDGPLATTWAEFNDARQPAAAVGD